MKEKKRLEDFGVNVKIKLSALWVVLMILYIYNDFFTLFTPGALEEMISGKMGPFPVSQFGLFSGTMMMVIPAMMIILSLILNPRANRIFNIIIGILYTFISIGNLIGETWIFYISSGIIQIGVTVIIILYSFKWPKKKS